MSTVIHRHKIPQTHEPFALPLPDGARVVHVGWKGADTPDSDVHLWDAHEHDADEGERHFRVVATGEPFDGTHVGTFVAGAYVWHVIELEDQR